MDAALPTLGVGLGFREPLRSDLFRHRARVDFLEVISDHFLDAPPAKEEELALLAEHFTLIPHGLNLSLGSAEGLDPSYLCKLARLIRRLDPPWWSEHIAFTRAGGVDIGHLSPLPYTREAVDVVCRNIAARRRWVDRPLILENIAYLLSVPGGEMHEADFLSEVVERTDCGLLLDVMNLHANAVNHGYDPHAFLRRLPLERVVQLHFVGGHRRDGKLIDSHLWPTPAEVWALLEVVLDRAPVKAAVLERDGRFPPFAELAGELEHARTMGRARARWA
jgi:uncharacterized protein (UPF0276 family)